MSADFCVLDLVGFHPGFLLMFAALGLNWV